MEYYKVMYEQFFDGRDIADALICNTRRNTEKEAIELAKLWLNEFPKSRVRVQKVMATDKEI